MYDTFIEHLALGGGYVPINDLHTYLPCPPHWGHFLANTHKDAAFPACRFTISFSCLLETNRFGVFRVAYARVARNEVNGVQGGRCVCVLSVCTV